MKRTGRFAALFLGCLLAFVAGCSPGVNGATTQIPPRSTSSAPRPSSTPTLSDPTLPVAPAESTGQPHEFQVISGLGVNANVHSWRNGELKPAIDQISELGDLTWRVIIDRADWETQENPESPETIDWNHYAPIYENGKMSDLWKTVEYINSKPGQQVMVNVMGGVPGWMGGTRIDESREDQWVRMISSMVAYGRTVRGLDFTLLGPMNETDWDGIEGPQVGPRQYVRLLHKLIVRLDGLGLGDMRLVGPDTASASNALGDYLPAMVKDPLVMSRLAHFGIHTYNGDSAGTENVLPASAGPGLDYWVTEFSGPCPGCDTGSPNPMEWSDAASTAEYAINLLEQGASGLLQYDAWDGYYEHHESMGYWGLLAYDAGTGTYTPRKTYFVLRQLIRYTPRNSVRIAASSDQEMVHVVAFQDPASGRVTLFGHNASDRAVDAMLRLPSLDQAIEFSSSATNTGQDMDAGRPAVFAGGAASYTAAPDAVFTLTGTPTKG